MYEVRHLPENEVVFEAETKTACRDWIRMGDRDNWKEFRVVDSMGQEVESYFQPGLG